MEVVTERNVVKQSYILNNSSFKFSVLALDFVMAMVSEIKNEDTDFRIFSFSISGIESKIGRRIDKRSLSKLSIELLTPSIEIEMEHGGFLRTAWFSSFEYNPIKNIIELSFDPKLKPYLLELKNNFALGYLSEITPLTSEYSKRIYMLLRQRCNIGSYSIGVEQLQKMLKVPKTYLEYKVFKARVLTKAVKSINETSSMKISLEEIKSGRKVESLKFKIRDKVQKKTALSNLSSWAESEEIIETEIA